MNMQGGARGTATGDTVLLGEILHQVRGECGARREAASGQWKTATLSANAAAGTEVGTTNKTIWHSYNIFSSESLRNQQFRAHLASDDPGSDVHFVQGLTSGSKEDATCEDSEVGLIGFYKTKKKKFTPNCD